MGLPRTSARERSTLRRGRSGEAAPVRQPNPAAHSEPGPSDHTARIPQVLVLRAHGYTVIEAPDGPTALEIASRPETAIDLVVSDVVMPGMSGPDLGRRLAELRPNAALILASGHAEAVVLGEHASRGGAGFLQKPFTPEELARKVREVLDSPRPLA